MNNHGGKQMSPADSDAVRKKREREKKREAGYALEQVWVKTSERDRMRAAGYKLQAVWVHPDGRQRPAKPYKDADQS
jgi:hypothetical protein